MKIIVYIGLLLNILCASEISQDTPEEAVMSYYYAMNYADVELLQKVMVKSSFDMTIEVYALSVALIDKDFAKTLKNYTTSLKANKEVKEVVRKKLENTPAKTISDLKSIPLGKTRCMIRYKEDGKSKQLFTSMHQNIWKINYKAGRKID